MFSTHLFCTLHPVRYLANDEKKRTEAGLREAWIALSCLKGIGPVKARQLVSRCGGIENFWHSAFGWANKRLPGAVGKSGLRQAWMKAAKILNDCEQCKVSAIAHFESGYPPLLRHCPDAPLVIYCRASKSLPPKNEDDRCLAIVGTRRATAYGRMITERIITELKGYHPLIVSGLAFGIDVCAHRACLRADVRTEAVLAHGLDQIRPMGNYAEGKSIARKAALWSEHPPSKRVEPGCFPRRNRIIAGMVQGVVVIESGVRGGSMITARLAYGYNREVMAIPGPLDRSSSDGCNRLICDQVATLVRGGEDIAKLLGWELSANQTNGVGFDWPEDANQKFICRLLQRDGPMHIDRLLACCKLSRPVLSSCILALELEGLLQMDQGMNIRLKVKFL